MPELFIMLWLFAVIVGGIALLFLVFVDLLLALGVMRDADRLRERGVEPLFVGPGTWALGVFLGSFVVLGLYWLVHHSRLATLKKPVVARAE